ncbi:MAG: hypothetical protein IJL53_09270 [Firmicutes bacterium]|nr:hypothetical protein [Bacillota bacterium]
MKNLSMFFSEHPYVFPALIGAILLTLLIIYVVRLISGRTGNAKVVTAVFEGEDNVNGTVEVWDRGRAASGNTTVVMEHRVFRFREQDTGIIRKFVVSAEVPCRWEKEQTGILTYAGKRFISFK